MKFPVALQLYSVRNEAEKDFEATLFKVGKMGYDGVEYAGLHGYSAEKVAAMTANAGLTPLSAHVPIDALCADPEGQIALYKAVGCRYIAVPYLMPERRPGTPGFEKTIEDIRIIGAEAKKQGIILLYHNHDFEFDKVGDMYALDMLYSKVGAELLQTELDTCWVNVGGEDPAEYIRKYKGRAPVVHLKDFYMTSRDGGALYELIGVESEGKKADRSSFEFRAVGSGVQNIPGIIAAAEYSGSRWLVVEQDEPSQGHTPLECAEISIKYLRSL